MLELLNKESGDWISQVEGMSSRPEPSAFKGSVSGLWQGAWRPIDVAAEYAAEKFTPYLSSVAESFAGEAGKRWAEGEKQKTKDILASTDYDVSQMGTVGQLLYSASGTISSALIGGAVGGVAGASAGAGAFMGRERYSELLRQGVDEETATKAGLASGAIMAWSVALAPYYGLGILTQVATGVGINVSAGAADRGLTSSILESNGYSSVAEHYKMLDGMGIAADAILGAAFPLGARAWTAKKFSMRDGGTPTSEQVDSALIGAETESKQKGLPVIPENPQEIKAVSDEINRILDKVISEDADMFNATTKPIPEGLVNAEMIEAGKVINKVETEVIKADPDASVATKMVGDVIANADDFKFMDYVTAKAGDIVDESLNRFGQTSDQFVSLEAEKIIQLKPDMVVEVDGNRMTVADVVKEVENAKLMAEQDAKLHGIAAACHISLGE